MFLWSEENWEILSQIRITDISGDEVIEWTIGLHLNIQTEDLSISNTKAEVSRLYQIKTIQRSFSVTLSGEYFITILCSGSISAV